MLLLYYRVWRIIRQRSQYQREIRTMGVLKKPKRLDKKLELPRGTSFVMGGFSDYLAFEETGGV